VHRQGQSAPALRVRVKVSVATTVKHSAGGQFVTHAAALPGNPYEGHTLGTVIPQMQALIGNILDRCITDAGYRGHNAPPDHKFQGLHERPEAPRHAADQARIQTTTAWSTKRYLNIELLKDQMKGAITA
jgi:hypothetical protein